jgi:hypothetical protein
VTDRRDLDLGGFRQRATGVPPPPKTHEPPAVKPAGPDPAAPPVPRMNAAPVPRRAQDQSAPGGGGAARVVFNVPWATSVWAKAVAKGLNLSLADLLSEVLTAHADTVAADLDDTPPVGKRAGSGPYDIFTIRARPTLRARIDETADQLGFASRSEFVSRLLENARRIDGQAYGRRLDERTQQLLQT